MPIGAISEVQMAALFWLAAMVIFIILEIATVGLYTIWFAGGCLMAFFATLLGCGKLAQAGVFVVVSGVLILFVRPITRRKLMIGKERTNAESLVGEKARVIEKIDNIAGTGRAVVKGQEWMARSTDDDVTYDEGAIVIVNDITGVKIIVKKEEE